MNEQELFKKYLPPNSIVYDIGANIGLTVRSFLSLGAKRVFAFEPSINNFPRLLHNTQGLEVSCFMVGLHDREYSCQTPFKDCATDYINDSGKKLDTEQPIRYVVLSKFADENKLPRPDAIKIDIEGMEGIVLKTFGRYFEEIRPVIFVEIHAQPKDLDNQNYLDNPHFLFPEDGGFDFNTLKGLGYEVYNSEGRRLQFSENWNPAAGTHGMYALIPINPN